MAAAATLNLNGNSCNRLYVVSAWSRMSVCLSVDMNVDCLDEKAVMTYVACLCDALHHGSASAAATVHRQEVFRYLMLVGFLSFPIFS